MDKVHSYLILDSLFAVNNYQIMDPTLERLFESIEPPVTTVESQEDQNRSLFEDYVSEESVNNRLQSGEEVQHLLVNRKKGVTIDLFGNPDPETLLPDKEYGAVAVITNQRVFFVIGQEDDNQFREIETGELTGVIVRSGFLSTKLIFETNVEAYGFHVRRGPSSHPEDVATYVRNHLILGEQTKTSKDTSGNELAESTESAPSEEGFWQEGPISIFGWKNTLPSNGDKAKALVRASELISTVDLSTDPLAEAISNLDTAKDCLSEFEEEPHPPTDELETSINWVESKLESLYQIHSISTEVDRKLIIAKESGKSRYSPATLENLRSSIDEAIEVTEELGRSSDKLEEQRQQLTERLTAKEPLQKADNRSAESDQQERDSTDSGANDHNDPANVVRYRESDSDSKSDPEGNDESSISNEREETDRNEPLDREPTREEILAEIERVSNKFDKQPTISEFDSASKYRKWDIYSLFDSWSDAVEATTLDGLTKEQLLDEIHQLKSELGYPPLASDIETHSEFSTDDFRQEFGSVDKALQEAGFDAKKRLTETVREVIENNDDPQIADFEAKSVYSKSAIDEYYESWDEAVSAVASSDEESPGTNQSLTHASENTANSSSDIQNELSECYETLRNLRTLCSAVIEARDTAGIGEDESDPMTKWTNAIESRWKGESIQKESYASQQSDRNPFTINEYRKKFGNGNRVTVFNQIRAQPPTPSVRALLTGLLDDDPSEYFLPTDPETGERFPVIVESERELELALEMLRGLPEDPDAAVLQERETDTGEPTTDETDTVAGPNIDTQLLASEPTTVETNAGEHTTEETDTGERAADESETSSPNTNTEVAEADLSTVSGVTESIAHSLQDAGYSARGDLREAEMDDIAAVDGISQQIAMRIKLDVGG